MSQIYFQISGYSPQLKWTDAFWDDTALIELVATPLGKKTADGSIELVLGLKRSGSSHLLITGDDAREIAFANRLSYPNPSSAYTPYDFESLSPIVFASKDQLSQKMKSLKPKKGNAPCQANRNYPEGSFDLYRGAFEHGRLFYQILNKTVDPHKYGVDDTSWTRQTRVWSFVFNVRGLEYRTTEQRKLNPEVLDFGICEAHLPNLTPNFSTAKHITNRRNKLLGRKQPKRPFHYGNSEDLPFEDLPQRIQLFFKNYQGSKSTNPIILLVCKEEETLNLLQNLGVDTAGWRSGIRDLLVPDSGRRVNPSPQRQGRSNYSHSRQPSYSGRSYSRNRSRSRSPDRRRDSVSSFRYEQDRGPETPLPGGPRQSYAPVYLLDVRELYVKLMQTENANGVTDIARLLKLTDEEGWCAGNEAATIINIWKEVVSSLPIDEQRDLRRMVDPGSCLDDSSNPTPAPEPAPYVYDSDDDRDPNEIVTQPQKQAPNAGKTEDLYDFDESDDSESD